MSTDITVMVIFGDILSRGREPWPGGVKCHIESYISEKYNIIFLYDVDAYVKTNCG